MKYIDRNICKNSVINAKFFRKFSNPVNIKSDAETPENILKICPKESTTRAEYP